LVRRIETRGLQVVVARVGIVPVSASGFWREESRRTRLRFASRSNS
jgi:hypothetical protein